MTGKWQGTFTSAANRRAVGTTFTLSATGAGSVTGTFELGLTVGAGFPTAITIKNGRVTQRTTSIPTTPPSGAPVTVTPVSGISIDFEWERAADKGKGRLVSVDEQTLEGTLGTGSSVTGSGTLKLRKL